MAVVFRRFTAWYDRNLQRRPLLVKCITSALMVAASDVSVQLFMPADADPHGGSSAHQGMDASKTGETPAPGADVPTAGTAEVAAEPARSDVDSGGGYSLRRTIVSGCGYGGLWVAPVMHNVTVAWARFLPSTSLPALVVKTVVDCWVFLPINISAMLAIQSVAQGDGWGPGPAAMLQSVRDNLWPSCLAGWKFWPAATMVMYGIIPLNYRVLFLNTGTIFWNAFMIWRFKSAGSQGDSGDAAPAAAVEAGA